MANQTPYCSTNSSSNSFDERELKFELVEFAQNPEPRCPCILLLDTSGSMYGEPINQLNQGLKEFQKQLAQDELAAKRVEVSVVSFNSEVEVLNNFETANSFNAPTLNTRGCTEMGRAIEVAINMLEKRKADYKSNGISYYRPWIFLITDGAPTDDVTRAISKVHEGEKRKEFAFFAVGTEGADIYTLNQISVREALTLQGLNFTALFQWLSNSMCSVSRSTLDAEIILEAPTGWAKI